ncbi:hypothetical protein F900_00700 [Acinetobacter modestus]|uniref:Uncharacterized protein n=1 Tax=Acinetobacter modestus TaxID=1776740 RepID=N9NDC5_9GAMM|nr:hypothetical protein F900_00700 [Acinetobacter modestus]
MLILCNDGRFAITGMLTRIIDGIYLDLDSVRKLEIKKHVEKDSYVVSVYYKTKEFGVEYIGPLNEADKISLEMVIAAL